MILAFANQKGGVGKTTCSVHYAAYKREAGSRIHVVDVDRQRHAERRCRGLKPEIPASSRESGDLRKRVLRQAKRGERPSLLDDESAFDVVVVDAPGDLDLAKPVFLVADLVVLPCGPTEDDLNSTIETVARIAEVRRKRQGLPEIAVVLNQTAKRGRATRHAEAVAEVLRTRGVTVCKNTLPKRDAVRTASNERTVVWKVPGGRRAGREMTTLFEEIDGYGRRAVEIRRKLERQAG